MQGIHFKNITKSYDGKHKLFDNFDLKIKDKEFLVLLGPSGSGKSTLLKILSGLEPIDDGKIFLDSQPIHVLPSNQRDIAMVFQNYALYPHMSVYKNIAINLILKKQPAALIDEKVKQVSDKLGISELLDRKPKQLSGGQMQRVALGRAMIRNPKVFLMDEPLSNLDAKLRHQTRAEIIKLQRELNTTMVYVTHDQTEAMTMADTIVLLKEGKIMQKGTPAELYEKPQNVFVASFIGTPQINFITLNIRNNSFNLLNKTISTTIDLDDVIVGIRPEMLHIERSDFPAGNYVIDIIEHLGSEKLITLKPINQSDDELIARVPAASNYNIGERVNLSCDYNNIHLFNSKTHDRIKY